MDEKKYTYEDMEKAYEAGYSRYGWEEVGGPGSEEAPEFRVFMRDEYDVQFNKTFLFTWKETLPLHGLIVKEMYISARDARRALIILDQKVHTNLITEMVVKEIG